MEEHLRINEVLMRSSLSFKVRVHVVDERKELFLHSIFIYFSCQAEHKLNYQFSGSSGGNLVLYRSDYLIVSAVRSLTDTSYDEQ